MGRVPLRTLDAGSSFVTTRFSDRSKFGAVRIWLPDKTVFDPVTRQGWSVAVRLHGGNGNDQGNIDPRGNQFLLMMLNELGCVVVSINWQDNGFYEPTGQDPRALFYGDGLLEPALIVPWLLERHDDPRLFGVGGFITRDLDRFAMFGLSDGGWRAGMLAYQQILGGEADTLELPQANVAIISQGHLDAEHFWMTEPSDALEGWRTTSASSSGSTTLIVSGGAGQWKVGHEFTFELQGQMNFSYLITNVLGGELEIWPALRVDIPALTNLVPRDNGVSKYSKGGYSWLGAPMFRAGGTTTWSNWPQVRKRTASLWPLIQPENPRISQVSTILLYPAAEPYVTNDSDSASGWQSFLESEGANPRYKNLHSEANAFVLAGLLSSLGFTEGTSSNDRFLLRAGGVRSNPNVATRYNNTKGQATSAVRTFLQSHGW